MAIRVIQWATAGDAPNAGTDEDGGLLAHRAAPAGG